MSPHLLFTRRHDARGAVSPTMALSSLATLLSGAALVLAFLAYTKAGNVAVSTAAPSPSPTSPGSVTPTPTPAPSVTTEESSGNETTPPAAYTPGQPLPTPTGDYVGAYPTPVINLVPNSGNCARQIDLDQPLVNATSDASDVQYYTCGAAAVLQFETPAWRPSPADPRPPGTAPTRSTCPRGIRSRSSVRAW